MSDHVHMKIAIPPRYAVSQVVGFIKGKSAIHMARVYGERKRNLTRLRIPIAPRVAGALPGRSTNENRYCSGSWLKVTKPATGR